MTAPRGLFGGEPGTTASVTLLRDGTLIELKSKDSRELRQGDILTVQTGGGAGYGEPSRRDPELARFDLDEGFVTG